MASGFPISAVITTPAIASSWKAYQQSTTFLGNPVGAAAALASIAELEERGLVERSRTEGAYFRDRIEGLKEKHPLIGDVRGRGMMVAIEVVKDRATKQPASDEGLRVGAARLSDLGIDARAGETARACRDWTEQRSHVAGPLGRALLTGFLERGWLERDAKTRALHLTSAGESALPVELGVPLP